MNARVVFRSAKECSVVGVARARGVRTGLLVLLLMLLVLLLVLPMLLLVLLLVLLLMLLVLLLVLCSSSHALHCRVCADWPANVAATDASTSRYWCVNGTPRKDHLGIPHEGAHRLRPSREGAPRVLRCHTRICP